MKKRILALLVVYVILLSTLLVGCGDSDDETTDTKDTAIVDEGLWYRAQYHDFTLEKDEYVTNVSVYDDAMYFVTQKYLAETGNSITKIKKMLISDFSISELSVVTLEEAYYIMDMYANDNGIYLATQLTEWDATYSKLLSAKYKVIQYDFEGNEIASIDITEDMMDKGEDGSPAFVSSLVCDRAGNVVMSDDVNYLIAYDKVGKKIADIEISDGGRELFDGEDGNIYYTYWDDIKETQVVVYVDINGNKLGEEIGGFGVNNASHFYVDKDGIIWMNEENSFCNYNPATEEKEETLNWIDYDINGSLISAVKRLENGNIFLYTVQWDENGVVYEVIIMEVSDEPISDKTILTYATFGADDEITEAIIRFNKNNENYHIKLVDYYDDEDYEASLNDYNEAILDGEMADLINVDWTTYKSFARKGLYADLNELINNDPDIDREDYFVNVLRAYEVEGKLCAMPVSFTINTLVGKTSLWGDKSGITIEELMRKMETYPNDVVPVDKMSKEDWMRTVLYGAMDMFVDWETGECFFDSEEFISILEMANRFPEKSDYEGEVVSSPKEIVNGKVLLSESSLDAIANYQMEKNIWGEEITAVGYPGVGGNGALIQNAGSLCAILDQSDNKEGAWEFVKYMISEDYQKNYIKWNNPIHKAAFEEQMEKATEADYYINEKGEKTETPKMTYNWDDFQVSVYAASDEEVTEYRNILEGATTLASYEEDIMAMIYEETEPFFKGQKTAQDVANIIQGRVKIYVNENR